MISVALAAYNGEKYIAAQLESILAQLGADDEVVVSDDGSTDATRSVVEGIGDSRIRLISNERHGVNGNFDNALRHTRGEIVFMADQDDVWAPGKVEECLKALKNCDLVVHDAIITDSDLVPNNNTLFSELKIKEGFINNLIRNRFTGCCMAMRREVLGYALPLPDDSTFFHDQWIGLMAELKGKVTFIPYGGIYFRRHAATHSVSGKGKSLSLGSKLSYRARLLSRIITRLTTKR